MLGVVPTLLYCPCYLSSLWKPGDQTPTIFFGLPPASSIVPSRELGTGSWHLFSGIVAVPPSSSLEEVMRIAGCGQKYLWVYTLTALWRNLPLNITERNGIIIGVGGGLRHGYQDKSQI